jgi:hypothetical protein
MSTILNDRAHLDSATTPDRRRPHTRFTPVDWALLAALLALNATILVIKGTERFEFFDMSSFMDAGYRVSIGQEPYVDFYYTAGPVHLYMHALSFMIFGFTTTAVLVHLCVVALLATALVFAIAHRRCGRWIAAFLALVTAFSFYGPVSHPWYDQNANIWIMLGVFIWEYCADDGPMLAALICGILAGVSFLTKSNVGGVGGVVFLAMILARQGRLRNSIAYVAGGLASLLLCALLLKSPSALLSQAFFSFKTSGRFSNFDRLGEVLRESLNLPILTLAGILWLLGGQQWLRRNGSALLLLFALSVNSIFSCWTGSMVVAGNLIWTGLQLTYLFGAAQDIDFSQMKGSFRRLRPAVWCLLASSGLYCLLISIFRTHELSIWTWNASVIQSNYELQSASFKGWRCNSDTGKGLDQTVAFINYNVPAQDSLLVFPDATIIYGMTGRDSYRKMPFIFHRYFVPAGRWFTECREHFLAQPPKWIVLHLPINSPSEDLRGDRILEWLQLYKFVDTNYRIVERFGEFSILRFFTAPSVAPIPAPPPP